MMTEELFDDYGHIDFDHDMDDGFLDMDALAAAEQLSIGARALADDGSILDLAALSADSFASEAMPGIPLGGGGSSSAGGGEAGGDGKESTGRWTREEHLLFIKGLEMYGKGWKKIAGLIKTRTVVQIRTHAQKYFLKLAKARQNGGGDLHSGSLSLDGKSFTHGLRKKKLRRRRHDKPIAVAPPLQPFVKVRKEGADAPEAIDVDTGLYQFLSAPMGTISTTPSTLQLPSIDAADPAAAETGTVAGSSAASPVSIEVAAAGADAAGGGMESMAMLPPSSSSVSKATAAGSMPAPASVRSCNSFTSFSGVAMVERLRLNSSERSLPEWYARGEDVSSLLKEAEALDWGVDLSQQQPTTTATTAAAAAAAPPVAVKKESSSPKTVTADLGEQRQQEGVAAATALEVSAVHCTDRTILPMMQLLLD